MLTDLQKELLAMQDLPYKDFQSPLIPTLPKEQIIGIRIPKLRDFAKKFQGRVEKADFLHKLPHTYYEENNLHAFLVADISDFDQCLFETERFLPYIDNWATCDSFRPKCFARNKERLLPHLWLWLASPHPYTVRFAIEMLMVHFLEESFQEEFPRAIALIRSEDYYVTMMVAWYFATALVFQKSAILPYFTEERLAPQTRRKAIRKALESDRIDPETKALLKEIFQ